MRNPTEIQKLDPYSDFLEISEMIPKSVHKFRWIVAKSFPFPVAMYHHSFGGGRKNSMFWLYRIDEEESDFESKEVPLLMKIKKQIPQFHSRHERKQIQNLIQNFVSVKDRHLRFIYKFLTGDASQDTGANLSQEMRLRIDVIASNPESQETFIEDLRSISMKESHFDEFWNCLGKLLNEITAADQRRKTDQSFFQEAMSIGDLRNKVLEEYPHLQEQKHPIPCTETIRLSFVPKTRSQAASLKCSGRFNVKMKVQSRSVRKPNKDAHYVNKLWKMTKKWAIDFRSKLRKYNLDCDVVVFSEGGRYKLHKYGNIYLYR